MTRTIKSFLNEVQVVLVIYRDTPRQSAGWTSLVQEAARSTIPICVFVFDNSPESQDFPTDSYLLVQYRHSPLNQGVSKAYNEGARIARSNGKTRLLLLDQDTCFGSGWFDAYFRASLAHPEVPLMAPVLSYGPVIVSPFRYWLTKGIPARKVKPGLYSLHRYFAVNSGLLINLAAFESVNGYDESIPLDFSDFAFLNKLKESGCPLLVIDLQAGHRLSSLAKLDEDKMRQRFKQYCLGSKRLISYTGRPVFHFILAAGRATLLGIQFRSVKFISILFQSWLTA